MTDKNEKMTLNEIAGISYRNARKRQENGAHINVETGAMLKHCATEVVEATEAYGHWLHYENYDDSKRRKNQFALELADIICCCTIIAEGEKIDLDQAVADCLEKNRLRAEGIGDKL